MMDTCPEYEPDETAVACALHPDPKKQNEIWVNIGLKNGEMAVLTMGYGEVDDDGFYPDYVGFAMNTAQEIDEVISMLQESKGLVAEYKKEFWLELGLAPPADE